MKKIVISFLLILSFIGLFFLTSCEEEIKPLDRIDLYEIKLDPREDGSFDMDFHIIWTVLDDSSEGPLEWVKIGIPNMFVDSIRAKSSNIDEVDYYSNDGAFIRIDFKEAYYENEVVDFSFSSHQSRLYTVENELVNFAYKPGWFPEIEVKKARILWAKEGVVSTNAVASEGDYYLYEQSLGFDETIEINNQYELSFFPDIDVEATYTEEYISKTEKTIIIVVIIAIIGFVIFFAILGASQSDPYMSSRGFCGGRIHFYPGYNHLFYGNGSRRDGSKIDPPPTSSGGFGGGGCACACACAGGGRAGCSKKDFYGTNLHSEKILKKLK